MGDTRQLVARRLKRDPQAEHGPRVDRGRRQEDVAEGHERFLGLGGHEPRRLRLAEGAHELLLVRPSEIDVVLGQESPHEREAVGVETRGGQADDRVARPGRRPVEIPGALHDADAAAGEVERVGSMTPGCSAVSPPTSAQPASRQPAATPPTSSATFTGSSRPTAM